MNTVNRAALIVKPKKPYVEWANGLDDHGPKLRLDDPRWENTIYLLSEVMREGDARALLREHYPTIFEQELASWHLVVKDWPPHRDFETFSQWFEVKMCSMVVDLCNDSLTSED